MLNGHYRAFSNTNRNPSQSESHIGLFISQSQRALDRQHGGWEATVEAPTMFGAYHALETFSQLVLFDFDQQAYRVNGAPIVIHDAPRFACESTPSAP